ncbi:MAG TPA: chromate efflux transporter [Dyella sp.]|uniref:chromate efflux transporter n=1 Tax=Dyella sp. TaxID=1869338 RepID=UPI002F9588AF
MNSSPPRTQAVHTLEVARVFLRLGLTSFGGPIAHVGYFHREFVQKRRWLDEQHFGQLLALCQVLPGPASSQLGFSIGLLRAGWTGAMVAFLAFTLPSALLMFAFAEASDRLAGPWGQATIHGLKLVAVAVVAQGVWGMARSLCPDRPRALLAAAALALLALNSGVWMQLSIVAGGAALGPWVCRHIEARPGETFALRYGRRTGTFFLMTYATLLAIAFVATPFLTSLGQAAGAFYRTGALVFGGGHVVLPLLQQAIVDPGWIAPDRFLAGYGAAQAIPGPMFTLSAYLGRALHGGQGGALGAIVSLLSIFLPGLLMVSGALPFWRTLASKTQAVRMLAGVNAAVVGLLGFALYDPVWVSAIHGNRDLAIAVVAFVGLIAGRWPSLLAVGWCVATSMLCTWLGM